MGGRSVQNETVLDFYHRVIEVYGALGTVTKVALVLGIAVVTTAIAMAVVVWLPVDHFKPRPTVEHFRDRHPVARWLLVVAKNAAGLAVLPLGVFMALPLVPGPGLVFILIGLSLLDFPGKRALERKLLGRPSVLRFLNDLRANFNRPPLQLDVD